MGGADIQFNTGIRNKNAVGRRKCGNSGKSHCNCQVAGPVIKRIIVIPANNLARISAGARRRAPCVIRKQLPEQQKYAEQAEQQGL